MVGPVKVTPVDVAEKVVNPTVAVAEAIMSVGTPKIVEVALAVVELNVNDEAVTASVVNEELVVTLAVDVTTTKQSGQLRLQHLWKRS